MRMMKVEGSASESTHGGGTTTAWLAGQTPRSRLLSSELNNTMAPKREDLVQKERALHALLRECGSVLIGYSGGVDSAYLAKASLDVLGGLS